MLLNGNYIWIWELSKSENGDSKKLIQKAKDLGIDGYILNTHDGSVFLQQASTVQAFKDAGLSCGAWGYCYGKNVSGEISAIRKTAALNPDFYVMDIESEFEAQGMDRIAEQMLTATQDIAIPIGYTSFAIPSYHWVPFDILSKYCKFTMPQIYWAEMKWDVSKAFQMSVSEYGSYGLPVYPIGQITSDIAAQDILLFNSLCTAKGLPSVSYWDYQEASTTQLDILKQINQNMTLEAAVKILMSKGIITSPDYWNQNAVEGKYVNGAYAATLMLIAAGKTYK